MFHNKLTSEREFGISLPQHHNLWPQGLKILTCDLSLLIYNPVSHQSLTYKTLTEEIGSYLFVKMINYVLNALFHKIGLHVPSIISAPSQITKFLNYRIPELKIMEGKKLNCNLIICYFNI